MSRYFVDPSACSGSHIYLDDKDDIKHITNVLRMKTGDELTVSDTFEWEYTCVIEEIDKQLITLKIVDKQKFSREPGINITLFQGIPKGSKLDDVVRKTTEMGICGIVPVFMDRTVVKDSGTYHKKVARLRTIAKEASKQCQRGSIPEVSDSMSFDEMISALSDYDLVIFPYENEDDKTIKDALRSLTSRPENAAVIIGPEGGFSDNEACTIKKTNAHTVTLGSTILRTETAGIVALAMMMYELEL